MRTLLLKFLLPIGAALLLALPVHAQTVVPKTTLTGVEGHYYLQSVMETGSELLLRKDGRFEWMLAYGAVDQYAQGTWTLQADTVVLQSQLPEGKPVFSLMGEDDLNIRKQPRPGTWVAIVGLPRVGPAAGIEVQFEARSGKTATAVSELNGDAIVGMPANETWQRAGLRRKDSKDDWQWFAIPKQRAAQRIAGFSVGDAKWLITPAFDRMELKRKGAALVADMGGTEFMYVRE